MANVIKAVSKYKLNKSVLTKIAQTAPGFTSGAFTMRELAGGLCNAVYLIKSGKKKYVVKIAPPKEAIMMRHEKDIIKTEAKMLKIMEKLNIPAPRLIHFDDSRALIDAEYFIMTFIEGEPLMFMEVKPDKESIDRIKFELGGICKKIASVKSEYFGIPAMPETHFKNNADFILSLFKMLLNDCDDKAEPIPGISPTELIGLIEGFREVLDEADRPCLVHADTWEGNLMVKDGKLTGLIDFAAMMYGDPLLSHDFHDFSPTPDKSFLKGYGKEYFTRSEWIRIIIYKIWMRLGMIAERAYREYEDKNLYLWVLDEFKKEVINLKAYTN